MRKIATETGNQQSTLHIMGIHTESDVFRGIDDFNGVMLTINPHGKSMRMLETQMGRDTPTMPTAIAMHAIDVAMGNEHPTLIIPFLLGFPSRMHAIKSRRRVKPNTENTLVRPHRQ
ncbi:MAG: hypothetical protein U0798_13440 [Gemmataceae bacterium]